MTPHSLRQRGLWRARIIAALAQEPRRFNELARASGTPNAGVTSRIIKELRDGNLIERRLLQIDPSRRTIYCLTSTGSLLIDEANALIAASETKRKPQREAA